MARTIIPFELRKGKDDDIRLELERRITSEKSRSTIIREALRNYFFGRVKNTLDIEVEAVELRAIEKDDAQLDDALDSLLQF